MYHNPVSKAKISLIHKSSLHTHTCIYYATQKYIKFTRQLGHLQRCCRHDDFKNTAPDLLDAGTEPIHAVSDSCCRKHRFSSSRCSALTDVEMFVSSATASALSTDAVLAASASAAVQASSFKSTSTEAENVDCDTSRVPVTSTSALTVTADTAKPAPISKTLTNMYYYKHRILHIIRIQ